MCGDVARCRQVDIPQKFDVVHAENRGACVLTKQENKEATMLLHCFTCFGGSGREIDLPFVSPSIEDKNVEYSEREVRRYEWVL